MSAQRRLAMEEISQLCIRTADANSLYRVEGTSILIGTGREALESGQCGFRPYSYLTPPTLTLLLNVESLTSSTN